MCLYLMEWEELYWRIWSTNWNSGTVLWKQKKFWLATCYWTSLEALAYRVEASNNKPNVENEIIWGFIFFYSTQIMNLMFTWMLVLLVPWLPPAGIGTPGRWWCSGHKVPVVANIFIVMQYCSDLVRNKVLTMLLTAQCFGWEFQMGIKYRHVKKPSVSYC